MDSISPRRNVYRLLIVVALGITVSRLVSVENTPPPSLSAHYPNRPWPATVPEPSPWFGSNDRSRWATVRSLVDEGTFAIGYRVANPNDPNDYTDYGIKTEASYKSVDIALDPSTQKFYSTKPMLLTVVAAGEYWLLKNLFGWDIQRDVWPVTLVILLTINVLPWAVLLVLLCRFVERFGTTDFGRIAVVAAGCFGTFLPSFAITFGNHTPAAFAAMVCVMLFIDGQKDRLPLGRALASGLFAGLTIAFDLPGALLGGCLGLWLLLRKEWAAAGLFALGAALPVAATLGLNYLAIHDLSPIYNRFGTVWYEYPGSHWSKVKNPGQTGVDFLKQSKEVYLFHNLVGSHGFFALTPVWIVSIVGALRLASDGGPSSTRRVMKPVGIITLAVFVGLVLFYVFKTNNFGGWTIGPRWLFWMTPLLLMTLMPSADVLVKNQLGQRLLVVLIGVAAFSAFYSAANPWRHPWTYQVLEYYGVIRY